MSTANAGMVEIAFGHTRLAALKYLTTASIEELAEIGITFNDPAEQQSFIEKHSKIDINIQVLNDEAMFEMAVTENHDRKDLSPIEEAKAMLVYRDTFGKTSDEIGALFHLSGSAVRNKLRLLDLPDDYKEVLVRGEVTEGMARDLLVLTQLPKDMRGMYSFSTGVRMSVEDEIKTRLQNGTINSEELKDQIDGLYNRFGVEMERQGKSWKNDEQLIDSENKSLPLCKGCPSLVTRNKHDYCLNRDCFNAKVLAWRVNYLKQASLVSGIPVLEHDNDSFKDHTQFSWSNESALKEIKAKGGCLNLRLVYKEPYHGMNDSVLITNLVNEGYPNAMVVCTKKEGFCTCIKAIKAGIQEETESGEQKSEADLKLIRQKVREQKKINDSIISSLVEKTASNLYFGLKNQNHKTLIYALSKGNAINIYKYDKETSEIADTDTLYWKAAQRFAEYECGRALNNPETSLRMLNSILKECALEELDIKDLSKQNEELESEELEEMETTEELPTHDDARSILDEALSEMNTF